jgi:hypothetical protein
VVREFSAELLKAFRERAPYHIPAQDDDVGRAYRQAARQTRERLSQGARAAFTAFLNECNLELEEPAVP